MKDCKGRVIFHRRTQTVKEVELQYLGRDRLKSDKSSRLENDVQIKSEVTRR